MIAAGGAAVLLAAVAGGYMMFGGNSDNAGYEPVPNLSATAPAPVVILDVGGLAPAERALAEDARKAGAPATAVNDLVAAGVQLDQQLEGLQALKKNPAQASAASARADEMNRTATSANLAFSTALLREAEARAARLSADAPSSASARVSGDLASLRSTVEASANTTDPSQSVNAARDALAKSQAFASSLQSANRQASDALAQQKAKKSVVTALPTAPTRTVVAAKPDAKAETPAATSATGVSPAKIAQFNAIIDGARSMAKQVIRMGDRSSNATRKANAALAKNYDSYLANLKDSGRGAKSDKEADKLIKQANQTKAYIVFLNRQSSQSQ
jgi:hypothetical protein